MAANQSNCHANLMDEGYSDSMLSTFRLNNGFVGNYHKIFYQLFRHVAGRFQVDETTKHTQGVKEKKIKRKKKVKNLSKNGKLDVNNIGQFQQTTDQPLNPKIKKKKKKHKTEIELKEESSRGKLESVEELTKKKKRKTERKPQEGSPQDKLDTVEEPTKKKKKLHTKTDEEYYPGMLSDLIQIKNYGRVIIPWDPSFGLDKAYRKNSGSEADDTNVQKLKINPLFDLSKRKPASLFTENGGTFFIGNLPSNTRVMDLKKLFGKYGLIYKAKLVQKKFKTTKKCNENGSVLTEYKFVNAVIKFKYLKSSEAVLNKNGTLYKDHHLRVTLLKDEPDIDSDKSVFVGNLAFNAQDDILWKAFEDCGEIESVRIIRDERSGKGKGFGYVNFKSADSVEAALKLEGKLVLDRELRVKRNNSRAASLSNLITVKRKKIHKKPKSLPKDEIVKKLKKTKKTSHKPCSETEALTSQETDTTVKKKMKKKKKQNEANSE